MAQKQTFMTAKEYRQLKPGKRQKIGPEELLHRAVAQYLSSAVPPGAVWTTVGHGGGGKARGGRLKAMGLKPGWPDIQILWNGCFLGIELKAADGRISPAQGACADAIEGAGGEVSLARSVDDVALIIRKFFTGPAAKRRRK
jgi:hypothetical protein